MHLFLLELVYEIIRLFYIILLIQPGSEFPVKTMVIMGYGSV